MATSLSTNDEGQRTITIRRTNAPATPPLDAGSRYSLVRVEQLDAAAPTQRGSGWRYSGPDGLQYRTRAAFETGFRISLQSLGGQWADALQKTGFSWFNAVQPGGDPDLVDFQLWARTVLDQELLHPDDADTWRSTFIDVEGGGRGKYL